MGAKPGDALSEALDRLYAGPFDAFLERRKELVASLRAAGDAAAARAVAGASKPTRTAWALDQVAHHRPELVEAMLGARDAAVSVQKKGDAAAMREAIRASRARTAEVLQAAREILAAAGFDAPVAQVRRMSETLAAASLEGSEARRLFAEGRLTRDLGQEDPFAGLEAGPAPPRKEAPRAREDGKAAEAEAAAAARAKAAAEAARKAHEAATKAAEERVQSLEAELREARVEARKKEMAAVRAQDEADRARRAVGEAEARLEGARGELRAMRA
jgi:hypothetical protein